jgi:AcrR family transcriptional regulator
LRSVEKTRLKILKAAGRLLAEEGFESLGVNRIAAEAGVGKPLIYRYFGDLEGLVAALAERAAADLKAPDRKGSIKLAPPLEILGALLGYGRRLASNGAARALLTRELARADVPGLKREEEGGLYEASSAGPGPDQAAIHAILRAAIVFLVICRDRHPVWDGLATVSPKDMVRFEAAVAWIVSQAWLEGQGGAGTGRGEAS